MSWVVGKKMNEFKNYHPIVNFIYFFVVIGFSMALMHPIYLIISLLSGAAYSVMLGGKKSVKFSLLYLLPLILITALINPAFNHEGVTILCYLPSDNPLTLESIVFGIAAGIMLASVICHFSCFNKIMTSDKFIYLFGKIIPSLSVVLSMALRFVPKFKEQIKTVSNAQKCIGRDVSDGNIIKRAKNGIKILSVMVTWSLENAIDTADSMKSRGYGLPGRTAFSNYKFSAYDGKALTIILGLALYVLLGGMSGGIYFKYFPSLKSVEAAPYSISVMAAYLMLCCAPIIIEIKEALKWKRLKSKI